MTVKPYPLWLTRLLLIVLAPVLLLIALWSALCAGGKEFWWEINDAADDVRNAWRNE